jgi:hypothetical protein
MQPATAFHANRISEHARVDALLSEKAQLQEIRSDGAFKCATRKRGAVDWQPMRP